jgi:hypothetical protein
LTALSTYLTDHRAGAVAGCALAKRLAAGSDGTPRAPFFADLAAQIEADRRILEQLMSRLGIRRSRVKEAAGWVAEKASRLKLNALLNRSAQLTTFLELEALSLGIAGKLALWRSLESVADVHAELDVTDLDVTDFEGLIARAEAQRDGIERERLALAADILRPSASPARAVAHTRAL